jgi:hypothetical protein
MIEVVMLTVPSFVAGGFALAWRLERSSRKNAEAINAVLKSAVAEAANEPDKFKARIVSIGTRKANRDARIQAIRERRQADRAARKAE